MYKKHVEFARSILGKIHEKPMIFCSSWTSPIEVPDQRDRDFNQGRSGCSSTCEKPAIALRFGKVESFDSSPGKKKKVYMKIYCNNESTKNNGITELLLCMSYAFFEKTWPIQVNSPMIHEENSPFKVMPLFWQHFEHSTWWHGLKPPPRNAAAIHSFVDQGKAESPGLIWSFYGSKIPEWWNGRNG